MRSVLSLLTVGEPRLSALAFLYLAFSSTAAGQLAPAGTSKVWGSVDNVSVVGLVQGPATAPTALQIACVFEYTEGDIYHSPPALPAKVNGMVHLDGALKGLITELRKTGKFAGHANETLVITPPPGAIAARRLLLIGLGDRRAFKPESMTSIGSVALREALRLGVNDFAFASDLKDAGIDSPTALVAGDVVRGIFQAYRTEEYLATKGLASYSPLRKVTLLAGPAYFNTAGDGIREAISDLNRR
ncbi:MAG TPA: M17 family peptidase N-terminal domain-containing protein [Chthoniobacterales bacterium]